MKKDSIKRLRLICGIVLSLAIVAAGICLMVACLGIYRSGGDQIYTAQKVTDAFAGIAVPVYLCLVLIAAGFVLDFSLPLDNKKTKAEKNYAAILARLLEKRDVESAEPAVKEQILYLRKIRKQERILSLVLLAAGSIAFLIYGVNPANFHQTEINASMAKAVTLLLGLMVIPFIFAVFAACRNRKSLQKEIELVKQIPVGEYQPAAPAKNCCKKNAARWVILVLAAALLVYGFFAGGTADVLTKAINICTECVGLG